MIVDTERVARVQRDDGALGQIARGKQARSCSLQTGRSRLDQWVRCRPRQQQAVTVDVQALVDENQQCKIADFGLSRVQVPNKEYKF